MSRMIPLFAAVSAFVLLGGTAVNAQTPCGGANGPACADGAAKGQATERATTSGAMHGVTASPGAAEKGAAGAEHESGQMPGEKQLDKVMPK